MVKKKPRRKAEAQEAVAPARPDSAARMPDPDVAGTDRESSRTDPRMTAGSSGPAGRPREEALTDGERNRRSVREKDRADSFARFRAFKEKAKKHGLIPRRVAIEAGIAATTYSNWESEAYAPYTSNLDKIEARLDSLISPPRETVVSACSTKTLIEKLNSEHRDHSVVIVTGFETQEHVEWIKDLASRCHAPRMTVLYPKVSLITQNVNAELADGEKLFAGETRFRVASYNPSVAGLPVGAGIGVLCGGSPSSAYLELRHHQPPSLDDDHAPRWLRLSEQLAKGFRDTLSTAIVPITNPDWRVVLPGEQLNHYVKLADEAMWARYETVRDVLYGDTDWRMPVARFLSAFRHPARDDDVPTKDCLEIGPGDFKASYGLLYDKLPGEFQVKGVDRIPLSVLRSRSRDHKSHSYVDRCRAAYVEGKWENYFIGSRRYEIVLAINAFARIRPELAGKAVAALMPGGRLIIIQMMYAENDVAEIARLTDQFNNRATEDVEPYAGKSVENAPYRVFAEDLEKWADEQGLIGPKDESSGGARSRAATEGDIAGSSPWEPTNRRGMYRVRRRIRTAGLKGDRNGLSEAGQHLVEYYLGNTEAKVSDWLSSREREAILSILEPETIRYAECLFVIERPARNDDFLRRGAGARSRQREDSAAGADAAS